MRFHCRHQSAGRLSFSTRRCANVIITVARLHNECVRRLTGLPAPGKDDYVNEDCGDNPRDQNERNEDNDNDRITSSSIKSLITIREGNCVIWCQMFVKSEFTLDSALVCNID